MDENGLCGTCNKPYNSQSKKKMIIDICKHEHCLECIIQQGTLCCLCDNNDHSSDSDGSPQSKMKKQKFEETSTNDTLTNAKGGYAVISVHEDFSGSPLQLRRRENALTDSTNMKRVLEKHGCHTKVLSDKNYAYYDETLIGDIREEMINKNYRYFVFVLSTHGSEEIEGAGANEILKHCFCTYDKEYETQRLVDQIAAIPEVQGKMKIFIIQACRSRTTQSNIQNMDIAASISTTQSISVTCDAESNQDAKATPYQITKTEIINNEDTNACMSEELNNTNKDGVTYSDMTLPHCDDCVVVFASMSGKYSYSSVADKDSGGWLIRAIVKCLESYGEDDKVHILDFLLDVNREISEREVVVSLNILDIFEPDRMKSICELYLGVLDEQLQQKLSEGDSKLKQLFEKVCHFKKLFAATDPITDSDKILNEKRNMLQLRREVKERFGYPVVKAQSCIFHNLSFENDDDFYL